jgi:ubiquinone biosynthesis protein
MNPMMLEMMFQASPDLQKQMVAMASPGIWECPLAEQETRLQQLISDIDLTPCREKIATGLIQSVALERVVPDIYAEYRPIIRDGVKFFLSRFAVDRLRTLCIRQLLLPVEAEPGERLLIMVGEIPTLFKLGQIIARHKNLDPAFRNWLIKLENGARGTDAAMLRSKISTMIAEQCPQVSVQVGEEVLAEASVGVVIPLVWWMKDGSRSGLAVAKMLRPHVLEALHEELNILEELGTYFDQNRDAYVLKNFRFVETARDIREALLREIQFSAEQKNLETARRFYGENDLVCVPEVFPFSSPDITIMEMIHGEKITNNSLTPPERLELARRVFRSLLVRPLFDLSGHVIFHGDPHAGNLFFMPADGEEYRIGFLDWSQAGDLTPAQRSHILQLCLGLFLQDTSRITASLKRLAEGDGSLDDRCKNLLEDLIARLFRQDPEVPKALLEQAFFLVDSLALEGMKFPRDLLVFRKSVFTVAGVLNDISPEFDMDADLREYLQELVIHELPLRSINQVCGRPDYPGRYQSRVSNLDLFALFQTLLLRQGEAGLKFQRNLTQALFSFP